jgi:Flagellar biosynthesis protein, FliO
MISRSRRLLQDLDIPPRQAAYAAAGALAFALVMGVLVTSWPKPKPATGPARSETMPILERVPPTAALESPSRRRLFTPRNSSKGVSGSSRGEPENPGTGGGWWFGTAGAAVSLALIGWGSVASRRFVFKGLAVSSAPVPLRVVGRASLSAKHSVYLVEVGDRVLILGAGPQGAPALLGELNDFDQRPGSEV